MDRRTIFHDMTMTFLRPVEPDPNTQVTFRLRVGTGMAEEVTLIHNDIRTPMRPDKEEGIFTFYACRIRIGGIPVPYFFEIKSGEETIYYDAFGVSDHIIPERAFTIYPGYRMPAWAKGAVMYQIFTDRFYNGDPTNDVLEGEYYYISGPARAMQDWNALPDAHANIREFYGGDLQGVIEKLDYLQGLGIEVIYFNPLFCSPSSHKYDTQDYDHIDPHFGMIKEDGGKLLSGTERVNQIATRFIKRVTSEENLEASDELLKELIALAHARGMKVILDGVFNHCGSFNKWLDRERIYENKKGYEAGAYIREDSPYRHYFSFMEENWPYNNSYDGWWGFDTLPKLNYEASKKLQEYIIGIGCKWVSAPFYADGWRLDVAADLGHSRAFNHDFWKRFRKAVKEANPNALILAEHYGDAKEWLMGDEWDSVMNYDAFMEPVSFFLTGMEKHSDAYYADRVGDAQLFFDKMLNTAARNFSYPSLLTAMNELSNHDHSRFLTRTNGKVGRVQDLGHAAAEEQVRKEVLRQAVMIQMTWPGAPCVYYGDEAGLAGFTDPDNRRTYPWGREDNDLVSFHKEIIRMHKQYTELKTGSVMPLLAERGIIAYGRFNNQAACVVLVNNHGYTVTKEIDVKYLGIPLDCDLQQVMITTASGYRINPVPHRVVRGRLTMALPGSSAILLRYTRLQPVTREQFWATNTVDFS
ncbi:MAG: alpha-glycosidase [Lachnospiraceae bacterium]|nr:alpha-glycosidase [Lachnospiraceae bacterium]